MNQIEKEFLAQECGVDESHAPMTKDEAIIKLWRIIDDIDSYGDMAKSDDKLFRGLVEKKQAQRWDIPISTDGYSLDLSKLIDNEIETLKAEIKEKDSRITALCNPPHRGVYE